MTTVLALLLAIGIGWWELHRLRTLSGASGRARAGGISVIIPARNESGSLPNLLASLAEQTLPPDQVIVVDDQSDDDTLELAQRAGATAFTATERPDGWLGKPWACQEGARAASGDLLVFLDADVRLAPDAFDQLVSTYEEQRTGLLSVQPDHRTERWWEQLSALPNLMAILASGALRSGGGRAPVAFGPCLVTDRASYERAGTHTAVAEEIIEDLALGRAYHDADLPVRCAVGRSTVTYRMYPNGLGQLVEGWTKNLAGGPAYVPVAALVAAVVWMLALSSLVGTVVSAALRGDLALAVPVWAITAVAMTWMLRQVGRFRWWAGLAFPLLWAAFIALFVRSAVYRALGRVSWRGRSVSPAAR